MINKNDEIVVNIEGYNSEGQGLARADGFVIFVPFSIKNEKVKVHIIKVTKNYAVGKIVEVIEASKQRVNPPCPYFGKCGGCALQHMTYEETLNVKRNIVKDALVKIGGMKDLQNVDIVPSKKDYFYRNKAAFPLFIDDNGTLQVAMFKGLSHDPVYIDNCLITDKLINKVAMVFKDVANKFYLASKKHFKYLVVRSVDNKTLVTVVTTNHIKNAKVMFDALKSGLGVDDESLGLLECIKKNDNNVILDGEVVSLCGIKSLKCNILGINVLISAKSFFQVNQDIMSEIYQKVIKNAENKTVIDAYSGAGLMSALLAKSAKHVYGLEIVKEATADANEMAKANSITILTNINCDVAEKLPEIVDKIDNNTLLVLDPPRKGVDIKVIDAIVKSEVKEIAYISCNPATLARDLKLLGEGGYQLKEVVAYDMFPFTQHVETVAMLEKS